MVSIRQLCVMTTPRDDDGRGRLMIDTMVDIATAVLDWREAKCITPTGTGCSADGGHTCCWGDNHLEGCPCEVARQNMIAVSNRITR